MTNKIYTDKFIDLIRDLSKNGAIIYGGSSLALRLIIENIDPYRQSVDFDIKKINRTNVTNHLGPSSQFKPLDINEKYFKSFLEDELDSVEKIKNERPKLIQMFNLKMNSGQSILLEFYKDLESNSKEIEKIQNINFTRIEKVFADKLHTFTKFKMKNNENSNNIRHVIDMLHIVSKYNMDFKLLNDFVKEKLSYENKNANKLIKSNSTEGKRDGIFLLDLNSKLIIYFIDILNEMTVEEIKDIIKEDGLYFSTKFISQKNIGLLKEVVNERIQI